MPRLLSLALAPTLIAAFYIYIRDRYEKEPISLLATGLVYGVFILVPVVHTENLVLQLAPDAGVLAEAAFSAFVVAALVEEGFKYIVLLSLIWKNDNFNEPFDGIVYAVFISLGFAGIENILYVLNPTLGGLSTAVSRAFFSVPGHALFGVAMGYYFALARFTSRQSYIAYAFFVPFLLHGVYDFILMSGMPFLMPVFGGFVCYLWVTGFRKMRTHLRASPFRSELPFPPKI